jgi:beta-xylosidase
MLTVVSIALSLFIRYLCNKKKFMKIHLKITLLTLFFSSFSYAEKSKVWVADNGDETFKNPVLYADYSDPDIIRVGKDYWMTASSFNCIPGLPILHSNDLVNWKIVNYALPRLFPEKHFSKVQHGDGVWAPSIRYHKGEFFIYWGDPDFFSR